MKNKYLKTCFISTLIIAIMITLIACRYTSMEMSSTIEITDQTNIIDKTTSSDENTSADDTASVEKTPIVSKPVEEPVTSKEEKPAPEQTPSPSPSTPSKTVPEETKTPESTDNSGVKFVQLADPETGISWDGVSPIIYTYPDGSTGTEKKDGATYEAAPGMITTYNIPRDLADREIGTICPVCQKEIQSLSRGIYCTQTKYQQYCGECGAFLQVYKCHTCTTADDNILFCTHCGKRFGDGTGGTCVRWLMGDVDCPMCGEHVVAHTCHSCDE